ncbi:MAG: hypothetical protein OEL20_16650 [Sulfuritalea sp.]|nr:hypothetical protein [Sulfuritalea sp.]
MSLLDKILGPKSKYDGSLPYVYEARIRMFEEGDEYKSYFSDTVCGLIEHLHRQRIDPDGVTIFEVYQEQEAPIDSRLFTTADRQWMFKPDICRAFEQHYPGHIHGRDCSFKDRDRGATGP